MMNNGNNNIRARGQAYSVYAEWPDGRQQTLGLVQAHSAAQALRRWAGPAPDGGKLAATVFPNDPGPAEKAEAEAGALRKRVEMLCRHGHAVVMAANECSGAEPSLSVLLREIDRLAAAIAKAEGH